MPDPLSELTDNELWNGQLLLAMICSRSPPLWRKRRAANLCLIGNKLELEALARGVPSPTPPHRIDQLRPTNL